jgi:hypothetical protein
MAPTAVIGSETPGGAARVTSVHPFERQDGAVVRRESVRWPLPKGGIEWAVGGPAMVVIFVLIVVAVGVGTRLGWLGWGLGIAFFTWLSDVFNRRFPSLRTRVRYLMCVAAVAGFVIGMPFSR